MFSRAMKDGAACGSLYQSFNIVSHMQLWLTDCLNRPRMGDSLAFRGLHDLTDRLFSNLQGTFSGPLTAMGVLHLARHQSQSRCRQSTVSPSQFERKPLQAELIVLCLFAIVLRSRLTNSLATQLASEAENPSLRRLEACR